MTEDIETFESKMLSYAASKNNKYQNSSLLSFNGKGKFYGRGL